MDILHVIHSMSLGGGARALITLAKQCARADGSTHRVVSLTPVHPRSNLTLTRETGLEIIEAPSAEKLKRVVNLHDIVHLHFWNSPEMYDFLRSDLPPMRLVVTMHVGGEFAPQIITRELVDFADRIQNTGPFAHDRPVYAELPPEERQTKVRMTYCPADFSRLGEMPFRMRSGRIVAYIGTVSFVKMHPDFVKLCAAVRTPGSRFTVCGPGDAYPLLERQSHELGIADRFEFLGERQDIRPVLENASVFGYPLCEDNYSSGELILQEAAYAGLPAVVFSSGGAGRMVLDGFTGHVVRSLPEYREAVEHLLNHSEERARMGRNAREFALQMYAKGRAGIETNLLYQEMVRLPKRSRRFPLPESTTSLQVQEAPGAQRFVQSLGHAAPQFASSMTATDSHELFVADERIATSSPVLTLGGGGIVNYREFYPEDPFLVYWSGLIDLHNGGAGKAFAHFCKAARLGFDPDRVYRRIGQAAALMGEANLAMVALERLAGLKPECAAAKTMLAAIAREPDRQFLGSSEDLWLQRMEALFALGDLDRTRELALGPSRPQGNTLKVLDILYRFGLACQKNGHMDTATHIYEEIIAARVLNPDLAAWAHFKLGELLLDQRAEARAYAHFESALEIKPNHAKARILLTPEHQPLRVGIGEAVTKEGYITLPMALWDATLWEYYFSRRRADDVRLVLDAYFDRAEAGRLAELTRVWLQPGAAVTLVFPPTEEVDRALHSDLEKLFSSNQLSLEFM